METYFSALKMLGHLRRGPSGPYLDGFAATLERQGYSAGTAVRYLRAAAHLGHVVARQGAMPSDRAGIAPATKRRPRLHDLRHTFAVRALQGSPADRSRSGAHMAALATYMGHVNIYATYWYLEATADLMRDVAAAGEEFITEGRQS